MSRLPIFCLVPALLVALPLAAQAQTVADSVVRTTVTTTVTTTTVIKPASTGARPVPATTSSTSTTSTTTAAPPVRQPGPGDLTGARSAATRPRPATASASGVVPAARSKAASTAVPRTTATTTTRPTATMARRATPADPELAHLVQTDVNLATVSAEQLPNLYERFLETTRAERRQWTTAKWTAASAALSRLNQRYEQVRTELSLEDKFNIRSLQGEFRALEAAKQVSKNL